MLEKTNNLQNFNLLKKMKPSPNPPNSFNSDCTEGSYKFEAQLDLNVLKSIFSEYLFCKRDEELSCGDLPSIVKDMWNHLRDVLTDVGKKSDILKEEKNEGKRIRRQNKNVAQPKSGKEIQVEAKLSDSSGSSDSSTRSMLKNLKSNWDCMNHIMSSKPDEALSDDEKTVLQIEFNRYLKTVMKKSKKSMIMTIVVQLLKDLGCLEKFYTLVRIPKEKNQGKEKAKAVEEPREEKSSEEGEQNSGAESVDEKETGEGSGFEDSEEAPPKKKKKTLQ